MLLDHPKVRECAVVGVPDEERGQIVKAFVVLRPGFEPGRELVEGAAGLRQGARSRPTSIRARSSSWTALPRTETGKLQRFRLRSAGEGGQIIVKSSSLKAGPPPKGYSNGVAAEGRLVFTAGQIGWNPETCRFETDDFVAQTAQALKNIVAVLASRRSRARATSCA